MAPSRPQGGREGRPSPEAGRSALDADHPEFRDAPCPNCGKPLKLIPILRGYPTEEGFAAARRGELALGGCGVSPGLPEFACSKCGEPLDIDLPEEERERLLRALEAAP
jgi:hypothetical protein